MITHFTLCPFPMQVAGAWHSTWAVGLYDGTQQGEAHQRGGAQGRRHQRLQGAP